MAHTITVSNADWYDPYYTFSNLPTAFVKGNTYKFKTTSSVTSTHPFSVGYDYEAAGGLSGSGYSATSGKYSGGEFEVTIPLNYNGNKLKYFCTRHPSMQEDFNIKVVDPPSSPSPSPTPAPSNAKCDTHTTCPSNHVLRANPSNITCSGLACASPTDDNTCCELGYSFGLADINLCPDDSPVNIVWAGTHNIQESVSHDCNSAEISVPLSFAGSTTLDGDYGFLGKNAREQIAANLLSDWKSGCTPAAPCKILALHGGGGSANSMQTQMKNLATSLGNAFTFVYASISNNADTNENWWADPPNKSTPTTSETHASAMVTALDTIRINQGPFWGIVGYSQGAAAVPVYLSNVPDGTFKAAAMFAGYLTTTHQGLLTKVNREAPFGDIPALIWLSTVDPIIAPHLSRALESKFTTPTKIEDASAGHVVPQSGHPTFTEVADWFRNTAAATPKVRYFRCSKHCAGARLRVTCNRRDPATINTYDVVFSGASFSHWRVEYNGGATQEDPTIEVCLRDNVKIMKTFSATAHPLKIVEGDMDWNAATAAPAITGGNIDTGTEVTGLVLSATTDTTYTYICKTHQSMIGKIEIKSSHCKALCNTHTCPSGHVLKAAAATTDCGSATCASPADDNTCCEPGYSFGLVDINLCPDDSAVNIVWAGTHNIQESEGYECSTALKTGSLPFVFDDSFEVDGHVGFLGYEARKSIAADKLSDWNSVRYFRCTKHCGGARIKVTCNRANPTPVCQAGSDYAAKGRVYDPNAPPCPHSIEAINASTAATFPESAVNNYERLCICSSCNLLFEAMTGENEICDAGTWHSKGSCDTFTCPTGFSKKNSLSTIRCGHHFCRYPSTVPGEFGYGTEGWGQGEPELDTYKCCDFDHPDFQYVKHPRNADGSWKNKHDSDGGCLSDKCFAKSQTLQFGHQVCAWNSGSCKQCDYCKDHAAQLPDKAQFEIGEGCIQSCFNYLYWPANSRRVKNICLHKYCDHCGFCRANRAFCSTHQCPKGYTLKDNAAKLHCEGATCGTRKDTRTCCNVPVFVEKEGCSSKCKRYVTEAKYEDKVDRFCSWSMCEACDFCQNHRGTCDQFTCPTNMTKVANPETVQCKGRHCNNDYDITTCCDSSDFVDRPGCLASFCARQHLSERFIHNKEKFCSWSACKECNFCKQGRSSCETFTCPNGYEKKLPATDYHCEGNTCGVDQDILNCCTPPTVTGTTKCSPKCQRYVSDVRFISKREEMCKWDMCQGCDYCKAYHKNNCDSYTCPNGFTKKCNAESIHCHGSTCSEADLTTCCDYPMFENIGGCRADCERYITNPRFSDRLSGNQFCSFSICSNCQYCKIINGDAPAQLRSCGDATRDTIQATTGTCDTRKIVGIRGSMNRNSKHTPFSNALDGSLDTYIYASSYNCDRIANPSCGVVASPVFGETESLELDLPGSFQLERVRIKRSNRGENTITITVMYLSGGVWTYCNEGSVSKDWTEITCQQTSQKLRLVGTPGSIISWSFQELEAYGCGGAAAAVNCNSYTASKVVSSSLVPQSNTYCGTSNRIMPTATSNSYDIVQDHNENMVNFNVWLTKPELVADCQDMCGRSAGAGSLPFGFQIQHNEQSGQQGCTCLRETCVSQAGPADWEAYTFSCAD